MPVRQRFDIGSLIGPELKTGLVHRNGILKT